MSIPDLTPIVVYRRQDHAHDPMSADRFQRRFRSDHFVRVVPGAFADAGEWSALSALERHRVLVAEACARTRSPRVISHRSAAALWGMECLGGLPARVETRVERTTGGRSSGMFFRRGIGVPHGHLVPWRGHWVTDPVVTALDIARSSGIPAAVAAIDQVLWARRRGGSYATKDELWHGLEDDPQFQGTVRATRAVDFGTALSDSVRESHSRVLIDQLGFPEPELQHEFVLANGARVRTDFWFPGQNRVGEFDGEIKYFDSGILQGRSSREALRAEKEREDGLRRLVGGVIRWGARELDDPCRLYDLLVDGGVPTRRPRPAMRHRSRF